MAKQFSANNILCAEHLLLFWNLPLCYVQTRGCICDQPPVKNLDTDFLMRIPGGQHLTCDVKTVPGGIHETHMTLLGEDPWQLEPGLPHSSHTFPFGNLAFVLSLS